MRRLVRAAIIENVFSDKEIVELEGALPGTDEQNRKFIAAAGESVDVYRKLSKPAVDDDQIVQIRFVKLADKARAYGQAVRKLDWRELGVLNFAFADEADSAAPGGPQQDVTDELIRSGEVALRTAKAIDRILAGEEPRQPRNRSKGEPVDRAMRSLVYQIGQDYAFSYGEAPSWALEGFFFQALRAIFTAAGISVELGETRLKRILIGLRDFAPAPKPGPKRRLRRVG